MANEALPETRLGLSIKVGRSPQAQHYIAVAYKVDANTNILHTYSVGRGSTKNEALADLRNDLEQSFDIIKAEMQSNG